MNNESTEYQYIQTQLHSNRFVKSVLQSDITHLLQLVTMKRQQIKEIENFDSELNSRIEAMSKNNEMIWVNYFPISLPNGDEK